MRNPYQKGSEAWSLFEAGVAVTEKQRFDSEGQDAAIDRHTIAIYRVGAAHASSFNAKARSVGATPQQPETLAPHAEHDSHESAARSASGWTSVS